MSSQVLENWISFKNRSPFCLGTASKLISSRKTSTSCTLTMGAMKQSPRPATCNAFAPNRIETAEHLSKLTGQTTVVKEQVTTSGRGWSTNVSRSTHEVSRPLLTPDEAMRMKGARKNAQGMITEPGNMVIYVAGYPAIMGLQPLYFRDSEL